MTTNWKELLEKQNKRINDGYAPVEYVKGIDINTSARYGFQAGHASLEPLLLKALEALELVCQRNDIADAVLDYYGKCSMALAEIKAELEGK